MKNIHVLPTDKPSRIYLIKSNNKLGITSNNPEFTENFGSGTQNQHIYITSDEEIKEGDVFIFGVDNHILCMWDIDYKNGVTYEGAKKIILTTDQDLIKDYRIQAIDDGFLEWFVKNTSCESVDVGKTIKLIDNYAKKDGDRWEVKYNIYIPKEEAKRNYIRSADSFDLEAYEKI